MCWYERPSEKQGIRAGENGFTVDSNKNAPHRHSRAGGNPGIWNCCNF
ncbi:hypothetical protein NEIELOOT_01188 [Neisseria elongata subsp. glycolytica ATCC 29315]|uniref:Uncharacterized protein n=1 Tax=Neisseria elongata subsp. glycolytica ATCC 29315 TaxID=546263 RepID=D4DQ51_NEIEG|nr:hypothetical protein NEIELOOT_01188 [Neisseria elongata subsp. glycolytica ATCC 29315]